MKMLGGLHCCFAESTRSEEGRAPRREGLRDPWLAGLVAVEVVCQQVVVRVTLGRRGHRSDVHQSRASSEEYGV